MASPPFGASQQLDHPVVGSAVIGVVEGEQSRIVDDLVERGDAVLFGQALVGQDALQTAGPHLEPDGGYVVADQGPVGHGARHEAVVVGEPAVGPEVELAVGHRYIGVGRRQFQIGRIAHLVAELFQQSRKDSRLHITGRPVSPRHRHRHAVAGAGGGRRNGFLGFLQVLQGFRYGRLGRGPDLFQRFLGLRVAGGGGRFGGRFGVRQGLPGRFQLGPGCLGLGPGFLGGAGVYDRDRRSGGGRGVICGTAAGRRQQSQHGQPRDRGSCSSRHRNRPPCCSLALFSVQGNPAGCPMGHFSAAPIWDHQRKPSPAGTLL